LYDLSTLVKISEHHQLLIIGDLCYENRQLIGDIIKITRRIKEIGGSAGIKTVLPAEIFILWRGLELARHHHQDGTAAASDVGLASTSATTTT
jgi:hypothetical protein